MANTHWNPADQVGGTLTNLNLTATSAQVRSVDFLTSGKYYWEYCPNVVNGTGFGMGVANSTANLSTVNGTGGPNACFIVYAGGGTIFLNGSNTGIAVGTFSFGASGRICVALDMTGKLIWFRGNVATQWNAGGTADPAAGLGGVNISAITSTGLYALCTAAAGGDQCIANFGDNAFSGVVPSGYTSGFPAGGGGAAAAQARAMVLA